jgi:hypothetical protein
MSLGRVRTLRCPVERSRVQLVRSSSLVGVGPNKELLGLQCLRLPFGWAPACAAGSSPPVKIGDLTCKRSPSGLEPGGRRVSQTGRTGVEQSELSGRFGLCPSLPSSSVRSGRLARRTSGCTGLLRRLALDIEHHYKETEL